MKRENTDNFTLFRKIIVIAAVVAAIVAAAVCIFDAFGLWDKLRDVEALADWINSKGHWAVLVYAAFVLCSVVFLPVPSTVMNYLATVLFDNAWVTFLVTTAATLVGSFICYALGRVFGKRVVIWLAGREKTEKYSRIITENGRSLFVIMLLLPFFPDDVICLIAGAASMSLPFFSVSVVLARPVMIALVTFLGKSATEAWSSWGIPVAVAVVVVVVATTILLMIFKIRKKKRRTSAAGSGAESKNGGDKADNKDE